MLFSLIIVVIILGGWVFGRLFSKVGLPNVLGMVICGIIIGFLLAGNMPQTLHDIEPFLKSFALIVILLRAGLAINNSTLKKIGLTAALMAIVPCVIEGTALTFVFQWLFGFDWVTAGLTGFMLAAVSPAIIVPSMLKLKDQGYASKNEVPTIVLAGASLDDVFAITIFTVFLGMATTSSQINLGAVLLSVPISIIVGIIPGIVTGGFLVWFFRRNFHSIRATEKAIVLLMLSVLIVQIGTLLESAAFLGIIAVGFILLQKEEKIANELSKKLSKLWVFAEILLFVLIGLSVDLNVAVAAGLTGLLAISIGLVFRFIGVLVATQFSKLTWKERLFCMISYTPKATVQAALGGVALYSGVAGGETILAIAVLSILFTAPLGLIGINFFKKRLLSKDEQTIEHLT